MSLSARKFTHIPAAEYLAAGTDGSWRHELVAAPLQFMRHTRE
jgi:hypothetical protein